MPAALQKFSLYNLFAVIVAAQAAILVFAHNFGNQQVDIIAGSILSGLAVLTFVGHTWFASLVITVPGNVYAVLQRADGVLIVVLGTSGMIVQYVGTSLPALTPIVAVILQGMALIASLFANLFKTTATLRAANRGSALRALFEAAPPIEAVSHG